MSGLKGEEFAHDERHFRSNVQAITALVARPANHLFRFTANHLFRFSLRSLQHLALPEEIFTHYRRHFPRLRSELCLPSRGFPSLAGALLSSDGVRNPELAVRWAIEAGSVAGTLKLLRWGFADWANSGHRLAALQVHIGWRPRRYIAVGALLSFHGQAFAVTSF